MPMGRRLRNRTILANLAGPEMSGLLSYMSGSRWHRDDDGHDTGGTNDDADEGGDDDADGSDDDESDDQSDDTTTGDDDADKPQYTKAEYDKVRTRMRAADKRASDLQRQLDEAKTDSTSLDEASKKELAELRASVEPLRKETSALRLQLAVMTTQVKGVEWEDPDAVLRMVDLSDVDVDDKGNIDRTDLRRALRQLAKDKPYLVKKATATRTRTTKADGNDDEDDDTKGSTAGTTMNGKRKGTKSTGADRAALAKRFPVLGQLRQ